MYKTTSPYVKELLKGKIKWNSFSKKTMELSIKEDKIIFIHVGSITKVTEREAAYRLFKNEDVVKTINKHFIPIALDVEDIPEVALMGLDMLIITEQQFCIPINAFSLPGIIPFTSFSSLFPEDFLSLAKNVIESFQEKKPLLEKAGSYMVERLTNTGIIRQKEQPREINAKVLHAYIKSWENRSANSEEYKRRSPYFMGSRLFAFLLKYYSRYNIPERLLLVKQRLDELYYSPMFDPIDGGFFSEAIDGTLKEPLYEKSLSENIQAAVAFSFAYKYLNEERYKKAAEDIINFVHKEMKSSNGGYINSITLNIEIVDSRYYRYTLGELQKHFPQKYLQIAQYLGMDINAEPSLTQNISNTKETKLITSEEMAKLKKIRNSKKELLYDKRVIASYNCMYISSLCIISKNIKEDSTCYISKAEEMIKYILNKRKNENDLTIFRYISSDNHPYLHSDLLDYACLLNSLLLLHKATQKQEYKILAEKYATYIIGNYYQSENGMFSKKPKSEGGYTLNRESIIDYVRFSANSIMARNLHILYKQTGNNTYIDMFKQQLYNIESHIIGSGPLMAGWALQILNFLTDKPTSETK